MFLRDFCVLINAKCGKWVKHSLLNSTSGYTSTGWCTITQIDTRVSHPADKCSWFHWTVKTGYLTQPDLNWGALQQPVNRQKFKNIDHLKEDLNRTVAGW